MLPSEFFTNTPEEFHDLFPPAAPVWQAIGKISDWMDQHGSEAKRGKIHPSAHIGPHVFLDEETVVEPGAVILGRAWIGRGSVVRAGCYVRENVIAGPGCVLGHASEFKNCFLAGRCEVPHFNYVGDSLLGWKAHLGAGVILSNVRLDRGEIHVRLDEGRFPTGLTKFGAIVGDGAEIGCNSVLNPGSLIGPGAMIHPLSSWTGVLAAGAVSRRLPL